MLAAVALAPAPVCPPAAASPWRASRLRLSAVAASVSCTCSFGVPRQRARSSPCRSLSSAIAPSPWVIRSIAAATPDGLLPPLRVRVAARDGGRVACPPTRRRARAGPSKRERRTGSASARLVCRRLALERFKLGPQARKRRIGLHVRRIDDKPPAVEQS